MVVEVHQTVAGDVRRRPGAAAAPAAQAYIIYPDPAVGARVSAGTVANADGQLLGSGDMEAIAGIPGVPLLPGSMVGRAAKALIFDEYTRKTVLKLVAELGDETVDALSRAK